MTDPLFPQITSSLVDLGVLIVSALIGRLLVVLRQRYGLEIEARHREVLHRAILTGLTAAQGLEVDGVRLPDPLAVREAVDYARRSTPDAIKALNARPDVLVAIAEAKLKGAPAP